RLQSGIARPSFIAWTKATVGPPDHAPLGPSRGHARRAAPSSPPSPATVQPTAGDSSPDHASSRQHGSPGAIPFSSPFDARATRSDKPDTTHAGFPRPSYRRTELPNP